MRLRVLFIGCWLLFSALLLSAQGVTPRDKPEDYPAKAHLPGTTNIVAAESLAHSLPVNGGVLFAPDHLVIEVAFFGPSMRPFTIAPGDFTLTINGARVPLSADSAGSVAMTMRDTPWQTRPTMQASGSVGNAEVIVGARRPTIGVPDIDNRTRGPMPPRAPESENRTGADLKTPLDVNQAVAAAALSACDCKLPVAGLLYFPYTGKLKAIKSLVLHYAPAGTEAKPIDLKLFP